MRSGSRVGSIALIESGSVAVRIYVEPGRGDGRVSVTGGETFAVVSGLVPGASLDIVDVLAPGGRVRRVV